MPTITPSAGANLSLDIREHTQAETAAQLIEWARSELAIHGRDRGHPRRSARSVNRWAAREVPPSPEYRDRIEKLSELRYLSETVFRHQKPRITWVHSPLPVLKGRTPLGSLRESGRDEVLGILAGLASDAVE